MVAYSYYPMDPRVRREAEILRESGAIVHVICARNEGEKGSDIHNNISIFRVSQRINRRGGSLLYFLRYFMFLCLSTAVLFRLFVKHRYKVVHIHSIPDYLVFCSVIPKVLGAKIILDLRELMPEVFATKFDIPMGSKKLHLAKVPEKISVRYADLVISTSNERKEILIKRTQREDIKVFMNLPKKEIFKQRDMTDFLVENSLEGSFIVSFAGGLNPERELDVVIKAIKYIKNKIPNIAFIFCGAGEKEYIASLEKLIEYLNLKKKVLFLGYVPQDDVMNYVAISNVTLSPYKLHPNLDPVSSTKVFEYLMIPKPVIVADFPANRKELEDLVLFYRSSDYENLGQKIMEVHENEVECNKMAQRAQEVLFKRYDLKRNEEILVEIYENLIFK
jgi:glycosyltransferase involved in cell wall biosynthesis